MKFLESPVAFVKHLLHMVSCRLFKFRNIGHQFRCASGKGNRISVMLTCNKVILISALGSNMIFLLGFDNKDWEAYHFLNSTERDMLFFIEVVWQRP